MFILSGYFIFNGGAQWPQIFVNRFQVAVNSVFTESKTCFCSLPSNQAMTQTLLQTQTFQGS